MAAAEALAKAGLKPIKPFAADTNALTSSDGVRHGHRGAGRHGCTEGAGMGRSDLRHGSERNEFQHHATQHRGYSGERPVQVVELGRGRVLDMLKGSYLFSDDPKRIIQDPESLRASSIRQASAWQDWGALRDAVVYK